LSGILDGGTKLARITLASLAAVLVLALAPQSFAGTSLVGDWPLDEGSGTTAADASGYANNGTLSGGVQWVAGHSGTALSFNGRTGMVRIPDSTSLEPAHVTVQAWVRLAGSPGDFKYIVAKGAAGCMAASYGIYSGPAGGLEFYVSTNNGRAYARSPDAGRRVWDGNWHLATGTYDGHTVRLYVDRAQIGAGTRWARTIGYGLSHSNDLFLGYYPREGQQWCPAGSAPLDFPGTIDAPEIWSRALRSTEIRRKGP
jgi:hypothetical protein